MSSSFSKPYSHKNHPRTFSHCVSDTCRQPKDHLITTKQAFKINTPSLIPMESLNKCNLYVNIAARWTVGNNCGMICLRNATPQEAAFIKMSALLWAGVKYKGNRCWGSCLEIIAQICSAADLSLYKEKIRVQPSDLPGRGDYLDGADTTKYG